LPLQGKIIYLYPPSTVKEPLQDAPAKNSFAGAEVRDQKSDVSKNKEI
jgi:hypothetical protein